MVEFTLAILDSSTGDLLLDDENQSISQAAQADLTDLLGTATGFGCALPANPILKFPDDPLPGTGPQIRVGGYWHNSHVEGPGRRSVVRMQGCPIRCHGCWVPETWAALGGKSVGVDIVAEALLDPNYERDGVTILGGEPFAQPLALAMLIGELRALQPGLHITVYSGYTLEYLQSQSYAALEDIDVLIDGAFVQSKQSTAGPYTGSGNQRVHVLGRESYRGNFSDTDQARTAAASVVLDSTR